MQGSSVGGAKAETAAGELSKERVLKCESLPTLPVVAMELLEKTSNPDVEISEIAELIQNDPGLAGKVLKTVNSSFYGLPKPCPSIDRAIGMLGLRAVKSLVLGFSMVNMTNGADDGFDMDAFWRRTILASSAARQVVTKAGVGEADEAFAAALFQDMGMLAIFAAEPKAYAPMVSRAGVYHTRLYEAEQKQWGFNHTTIGAELAERWRMPEQIVASIRYHHNPSDAPQHLELVQAVALGSIIARTVIEGVDGLAFSELLDKASAWFGWNQQDIAGMLEKVTATSKEVARVLGQSIGELPDPQTLLAAANQRLVEQQIQVQRESETFEKQAKAFEQAATTDGLTGIANRKRFDEVVEAAMAHALQAGEPLGVLFSDADKFKLVNDNYGHHAGDLVLIELARRLTEALGDRGTVCRYGGEEFAVVLPGMDLQAASAVGEELRLSIANSPFDLAGVPNCPDELDRTVSVGVATWEKGQPKVPAEELVQRADKAVYLAKESGRNNVKRWGIDLDDSPEPAPPSAASADAPQPQPPTDDILPDLNPEADEVRVLLVEDDALAARLIEAAFSKTPHVRLTLARDGNSAVKMLRDCLRPGNKLPDLIISDLKVPGFTGLQILKALKGNPKFQAIPMVILTAEEESLQLQACRDAGAAGVYNKLEICATLHAWCEGLLSELQIAA